MGAYREWSRRWVIVFIYHFGTHLSHSFCWWLDSFVDGVEVLVLVLLETLVAIVGLDDAAVVVVVAAAAAVVAVVDFAWFQSPEKGTKKQKYKLKRMNIFCACKLGLIMKITQPHFSCLTSISQTPTPIFPLLQKRKLIAMGHTFGVFC